MPIHRVIEINKGCDLTRSMSKLDTWGNFELSSLSGKSKSQRRILTRYQATKEKKWWWWGRQIPGGVTPRKPVYHLTDREAIHRVPDYIMGQVQDDETFGIGALF